MHNPSETKEAFTPYIFPNLSEKNGSVSYGVNDYKLSNFDELDDDTFETYEVYEEKNEDYEANLQAALDEALKVKEEAEKQARAIMDEVHLEADNIKSIAREEGYKSGYSEGYMRGKEQAVDEYNDKFKKDREIFYNEIKEAVGRIEKEKDAIVDKYLDSLKELAVSVAEKVINVSLKSSGDVIKRMILFATEKIRNRQWAKIYISKHDADLTLNGDSDILDAVQHISDQVKLVIMENKPEGTCIVELPDQIIDASAGTQLDNIKEILGA